MDPLLERFSDVKEKNFVTLFLVYTAVDECQGTTENKVISERRTFVCFLETTFDLFNSCVFSVWHEIILPTNPPFLEMINGGGTP